jgi:hypothetical protein
MPIAPKRFSQIGIPFLTLTCKFWFSLHHDDRNGKVREMQWFETRSFGKQKKHEWNNGKWAPTLWWQEIDSWIESDREALDSAEARRKWPGLTMCTENRLRSYPGTSNKMINAEIRADYVFEFRWHWQNYDRAADFENFEFCEFTRVIHVQIFFLNVATSIIKNADVRNRDINQTNLRSQYTVIRTLRGVLWPYAKGTRIKSNWSQIPNVIVMVKISNFQSFTG